MVTGISAEAPPVADEARRKWRSGRRLQTAVQQSRAPQEGTQAESFGKFKKLNSLKTSYKFAEVLKLVTRRPC